MKVALPATWQKVNVARWRFWSSAVFLASLSVATLASISVGDKVLPLHNSLLNASQGNATGLEKIVPGPAEANGVFVWVIILLPYVIMMVRSKKEMAAEAEAVAEATAEAVPHSAAAVEEPVYRIYNPSVPGAVEAWLPEPVGSAVNISEEEDNEKVFRSSAISFTVLFGLGFLKWGSVAFAFIVISLEVFADFILLMNIVLVIQGLEALLNALFAMSSCKKLVRVTVKERV